MNLIIKITLIAITTFASSCKKQSKSSSIIQKTPSVEIVNEVKVPIKVIDKDWRFIIVNTGDNRIRKGWKAYNDKLGIDDSLMTVTARSNNRIMIDCLDADLSNMNEGDTITLISK